MIKLKNISSLAYVALFGGICGYILYGQTMVWVWLLFELVGGVCLVIKSKRTTNQFFKNAILASDILITLFLIVLNFAAFVPMTIKTIIFFIVTVSYILIYFNLLFKGKLIDQKLV